MEAPVVSRNDLLSDMYFGDLQTLVRRHLDQIVSLSRARVIVVHSRMHLVARAAFDMISHCHLYLSRSLCVSLIMAIGSLIFA